MVKELQVDDPRPLHTQEQLDQIRWEQTYLGIPPPDWARELAIESEPTLQWLYEKQERLPSAVRANAAWESYLLQAGDIANDPRTPGQRLKDILGY